MSYSSAKKSAGVFYSLGRLFFFFSLFKVATLFDVDLERTQNYLVHILSLRIHVQLSHLELLQVCLSVSKKQTKTLEYQAALCN